MRVVILTLFAAASLVAQTVTGSVRGTVKDASGSAVSGAALKLVSEATSAVRNSVCDQLGNFTFNAVPPGAYTLVVEHSGFKQHQRMNIEVAANEGLSTGDILMEVADVAETVTVTEQGTTVQLTSGERSRTITSSEVSNLTVINRDFASLVALQPGVVEQPGAELQGYGANVTFNVQGSRSTGNNITIDGMPSQNWTGTLTNTFISMDSISTVRVLVSNFQAEFGRKPGAGIHAVTKSGTRDFHGVAYWYTRHEQFNANSFFNNRQSIPEAPYRYTTAGFNVGGPLYIPGLFNRNREKFFFFFASEQLREARAVAIQQLTMPTELERRGDFSDSRDLNARLITVNDPLSRQPFPGNVIPANRINQNGRNYLNLFPTPNFFDVSISGRRYNYQTQESLRVPKHVETARVDYTLDPNTTVYGRFNYWSEDVRGNAVPAGNGAWGWLPVSFKDVSKTFVLSGTRILNPTTIVESSVSLLRAVYTTSALDDASVERLSRVKSGVNIPQFHPENNPYNLVPEATFGGITGAASTVIDDRFPFFGSETILSWNAAVTKTLGSHSGKAGFTLDRFIVYMGQQGNFNGTFNFSRDTNNPNDSNHPYSNALLGNFTSYVESTTRPGLNGRNLPVEWYVQDNWKAARRLTLDFGMRFAVSQAWHSPRRDEAGFVPSQWNPASRVSLIRPVIVGGQRVGINPSTGQIYPQIAIGAIAPSSGDPFNGTVTTAGDPNYPQGMRDNSGLKFAPRFGFAYDPIGKGSTAIRGGFGVFYEVLEGNNANYGIFRNPPARLDPIIYYGNLDTFTGVPGLDFPSATTGFDRARPLARIMNYSFGIQQEVGFETVVDVSYVGSLGRHLVQGRDLNAVPFGSNFLAPNQDPTNANRPLPASFLRPYIGYNNINYFAYDGNSSYHSMQVTANRRFVNKVQFGFAWTWSKAMDYVDADQALISTVVSPRVWNYGKAGSDRTHVVKLSWIWDLPKASRLWNNPVLRRVFDDWQMSGIMSMISGAPLGVNATLISTTDITGSPTHAAARPMVIANPLLPKGDRTFGRNFNTTAFAPPIIGMAGNAAKDVFRGPGINNWDMSLFKNIPLPGERVRLQFRGEAYNAFNHTQFSNVDINARFDAQGGQTNARFGEFIAARNPRRIQLALRLSF